MKKRGIHNRRAQAAIFIALAVMIVLFGMIYFVYLQTSVENLVQVTPVEASPVQSFIDSCVKSVAEEGLQTIGLTGGYIEIPDDINRDPRSYLTTAPGTPFKNPYWWHDGIEAMPTEGFINLQLKRHIEAELPACLNDFEALEGRFEINELGKPRAVIKFNENDVSVNLEYEIEVIQKNGDFKALLENFQTSVPVRFKKVYGLAKLMMERENIEGFLEKKTIDLYSMNPAIPTTDLEMRCSTKKWYMQDIKNELTESLRINIPYIRIDGTDWNPDLYVDNPSGADTYADSYYNFHYVWELEEEPLEKYSNMKVSFTYDSWPMKIIARPSEDGVLKSDSQKGAEQLKFLCLHIWHFTYDISYPVFVSVFDQDAPGIEPYQFNFAFMVDIDHNQPNRQHRGTTIFEGGTTVSEEEYCSSVENQITVFTINNATGEDIRGINLTYTCGRYTCQMGASDWLSLGAAAGATSRLPYCVNGILRGNAPGYAEGQMFAQTDVDGRSYILMMNPTKKIDNFKVVKHMLSSPNSVSELEGKEIASILIKGKDNGFDSFTVYPQDAQFPLELPVGKDASYEITIYLLDDETLIGGFSGEWSISRSQLDNLNEIVFHVVEQGPATEDERNLFLAGLESYSKNIPQPEVR